MRLFFCIGLILMNITMFSQQDDIFDELDDLTIKESNNEVIATFKSTRLMLGQSTERVKVDQLHFRISHVFSKIRGIDNFFGMDNINKDNFKLVEYVLSGLLDLAKPN